MQPDTLHTQLNDEIQGRLALARALAKFGAEWIAAFYSAMDEWRIRTKLDREVIADVAPWAAPAEDAANYIALHDPADAVRRYTGELEVLERHAPCTEGNCCGGDCHRCAEFHPCSELQSLAGRLGVSVDG